MTGFQSGGGISMQLQYKVSYKNHMIAQLSHNLMLAQFSFLMRFTMGYIQVYVIIITFLYYVFVQVRDFSLGNRSGSPMEKKIFCYNHPDIARSCTTANTARLQ